MPISTWVTSGRIVGWDPIMDVTNAQEIEDVTRTGKMLSVGDLLLGQRQARIYICIRNKSLLMTRLFSLIEYFFLWRGNQNSQRLVNG